MKLILTVWVLLCAGVLCAQPQGWSAMPAAIQSRWNEYRPISAPDGQTLLFARSGHVQNTGQANEPDVWMSQRKPDGQWGEPVNLGFPLNSVLGEEPVALSADNSQLYLLIRGGTSTRLARCKRFGLSWSAPEILTWSGLFANDIIKQVTLSADLQRVGVVVERQGRTLMLSAISLENGTGFGALQVCNIQPNLKANICSATIAADAMTVYLVSAGPQSNENGVYRIVAKDANWSEWFEPEPLFALPDSLVQRTEIGISANGQKMYVSYGFGQLDLFEWDVPQDYRPAHGVTLLHLCAREGKITLPQTALVLYQIINKQPAPFANTAKVGCADFIIPQSLALLAFGTKPGYYIPVRSLQLMQLSEQVPDAISRKMLPKPDQNPDRIAMQRQMVELDSAIFALDQKRKAFKYLPIPLPPQTKVLPVGKELESLRDMFQSYLERQDAPPMDVSPGKAKPDTSTTARLAAIYAEATGQEVSTSKTQVSGSEVSPPPAHAYASEQERLKAVFAQHHNLPVETSSPVKPVSDPKPALTTSTTTWLENEMQRIWQNELKAEMWQTIWSGMAARYTDALPPEERGNLSEAIEAVATTVANESFPALPDANTKPYDAALREEIRANAKAYMRKEQEARAKQEMQVELDYQMKRVARAHLVLELEKPIPPPQKTLGMPAIPIAPKESKPVASLVEKEMFLTAYPVKVGASIPLPGVQYNPDTDQLLPMSDVEIGRLINWLTENETIEIEISAHTNSLVDEATSQPLTAARARKLMNRLQQGGIAPERMRALGLGSRKLIEVEHTFGDQLENERVEIRIIKD